MDKTIYIDFDGVIADTQKKIDYYFSLFNNTISPEWNRFLENINWKLDVLKDAEEINNSLSILKELYKMKRDIYILSRVFSLNEYYDKREYLKDRGIDILFIPSPKRVPKSLIVTPNKNRILVDDSKDNINDWINNNGKGIYFTNNLNNNEFNFKYQVDSLDFLLQKKL